MQRSIDAAEFSSLSFEEPNPSINHGTVTIEQSPASYQHYGEYHPSQTLSQYFLSNLVGIIVLLLPNILIFGHRIISGKSEILGTFSHYYYTEMRDIFVASLCGMSIIFMAYRGRSRLETAAINMASLAAILVAMCPTTPGNPTPTQEAIGLLHLLSGITLFSIMGLTSLFLFTWVDPRVGLTPRKRIRNQLYSVCGGVILAAVFFVGVLGLFPFDLPIYKYNPAIWLEYAAMVSFACSWLVKGGLVYGEKVSHTPMVLKAMSPSRRSTNF